MKRYSLITLDPEEVKLANITFKKVKDNAYFEEEYDTVNGVLRDLIQGFNNDFFSDQNFHVVVDNIEEEILYI